MALILESGTCKHCDEPISKRRYAFGGGVDGTVDVWVTGSGAYPGEQRICESNVMDDDIGSYGYHEPIVILWRVTCEDGRVRHDDDFVNLADAKQFAEWGHCCTSTHTIARR